MDTLETTPIASPEKWVTAITDLMELTQKKQLLWREDKVPRHPLPGPCYLADFNGNTLILQPRPFSKSERENALLMLFRGLGGRYVLRVFRPDGEQLTVFPSVAAINGLKIAIDAQLHHEEDSFLQAIHQATQKVA